MSNWINVKKRLPEKDGYYLVFYGRGDSIVRDERQIMMFHSDDKVWVDMTSSTYNSRYVTHWMELPEKPKNS
jgi:hypothetical protein